MVRDESRHILALSEYRGPPSALSKGEPSAPLERFTRRDEGQREAAPALAKGEKVQQQPEGGDGGRGLGALFGQISGNKQQEAVAGLPLRGRHTPRAGPFQALAGQQRPQGGGCGARTGQCGGEGQVQSMSKGSQQAVGCGESSRQDPGRACRGGSPRAGGGWTAVRAHVRAVSLPASGLPWTQGLVCPPCCLGGPCLEAVVQTPGPLFQFQDPSDTCLDWREQFLQVVQEAFAKEREMLAAGLQPRLCACDPGAPSTLSQNPEKVAPEQVSLGLVSPSPLGVTWLSFQMWTTFSCLNSTQ